MIREKRGQREREDVGDGRVKALQAGQPRRVRIICFEARRCRQDSRAKSVDGRVKALQAG